MSSGCIFLYCAAILAIVARECACSLREDFASDSHQLLETCRLETMEGRCHWRSEVIVMTSARWGRMKTGRCLEIHPNSLAAQGHDPLFLGCSEDVLSIMDRKCSGRASCDVRIPDPTLDEIKPCYPDLTRYLITGYVCVKAVQESRRCVVSVTTEAQFISSSSSTSSDVNSVSSCGSKSHPWRLEAAAGQRINISLLDFTAMSMSAADRPRDRVTCRQYGYVLEKLNKRNVSVCGGGGAELRQSHVYISHSNNVHVIQTRSKSNSQQSQQNYLVRMEAVGCTNMIPPENAWLRRSNNDIIIGCYSSQQTWQLKCDGREWKGLVGTCPELYTGTVEQLEGSTPDNSLQVLLVMVVIAASAVIICVTVVCIGCFCLRSYKRDAMKLKMSNGGATDIYLSNSRCVRNNDKPVDSNVFTGRLPVSSGPQHHQWQQQHQQLLMQADDK